MMRGPYREAVSLEGWQQRFRTVLASRFGLRLHMTLMMFLVIGTGILAARVFLPVVGSMAARYGLAVVCAYAAFFGLVRLWLRYASETLLTEAPRDVIPAEARALVGQLGEPIAPVGTFVHGDAGVYHAHAAVDAMHIAAMSPSGSGRGRSWDVPDPSMPDLGGSAEAATDGGGGGGGVSLDVDGEGLAAVVVIAVVVAVVAAVFGAAALSVWQAPAILGEAAFELVLAATLARAARRVEGRSWSRTLWKATWGRALVVLVMAVGAGAIAQSVCPGVNTMREAYTRCVATDGAGR